MRSIVAATLGLVFVAVAGAQAPPANALDITNPPTATSTPAPTAVPVPPPTPTPEAAGVSGESSTAIAPPATVLRVYIDTLSGADTAAITGLLAQALYQSKQVVVTENQSNASVIVRGEVLREQLPAAQSSRAGHASSRRKSPNANAAGASQMTASGTDLDGLDLNSLPGLGTSNAPVDLSKYRYRLNLMVVDPAGDVVWMSGRGEQAAPFQAAGAAVAQTVEALVGALKAGSTGLVPTTP